MSGTDSEGGSASGRNDETETETETGTEPNAIDIPEFVTTTTSSKQEETGERSRVEVAEMDDALLMEKIVAARLYPADEEQEESSSEVATGANTATATAALSPTSTGSLTSHKEGSSSIDEQASASLGRGDFGAGALLVEDIERNTCSGDNEKENRKLKHHHRTALGIRQRQGDEEEKREEGAEEDQQQKGDEDGGNHRVPFPPYAYHEQEHSEQLTSENENAAAAATCAAYSGENNDLEEGQNNKDEKMKELAIRASRVDALQQELARPGAYAEAPGFASTRSIELPFHLVGSDSGTAATAAAAATADWDRVEEGERTRDCLQQDASRGAATSLSCIGGTRRGGRRRIGRVISTGDPSSCTHATRSTTASSDEDGSAKEDSPSASSSSLKDASQREGAAHNRNRYDDTSGLIIANEVQECLIPLDMPLAHEVITPSPLTVSMTAAVATESRCSSASKYSFPLMSRGQKMSREDDNPNGHTAAPWYLSTRNRWILVVLALITTTLIVVCLVIADTRSRANDSNSNSFGSNIGENQQPPMTPQESRLQSLLPGDTLAAILDDPQSPQSLAYLWILSDTTTDVSSQALPAGTGFEDWRIRQRFALATFHYATNGPTTWTKTGNWLDYSVHECDWLQKEWPWPTDGDDDDDDDADAQDADSSSFNAEHPACNTAMELVYMVLPRNNLTGDIPDEFFWLTAIKAISLSTNPLSTTLSTHVGQLTNLVALDMISSGLQGTVPTEIGRLTNLAGLLLVANYLDGTIPAEISGLTNLEYLLLGSNNLSGSIPASIGLSLSNLAWLFLEGNNLTGTIPAALGQLSELEDLALPNNLLVGSIPPELGKMSALRNMHLLNNALTGEIPIEVGELEALEELWLDSNQLSSILPSELGQLTNLFKLSVKDNTISGPIPSHIGTLSLLDSLNLADNGLISGPIPSEIGLFSHLTSLDLSGNELTGNIPPELGGPTMMQLVSLVLENNTLSGPVPDLSALVVSTNGKGLQELKMSGNEGLSGTIPAEICAVQRFSFRCSPILCGCSCECSK